MVLWENLKETDHMAELGVDRNIILKWILKIQEGRVWTGLIWFSLVTSGGLLSTR
jgi:hypothetical protein